MALYNWTVAEMFSIPKISRKCRVFFHCLGLSCLGSALFLQSTAIASIVQHGYFKGIEQNPIVLLSEIGMTIFAIAYFAYLYISFIITHK